MTFSPSNLIKLTLVSLVLWSTFSCNKDSDILTDYVVENPEALLPNDIVATLPNSPIIIDPLGKDTVEKPENVIITEVTPPTLGTAIVNNDNTITYTPDEDKSGTDKFDYTASVTNPDNSVTTATGNVTVNIEEEEEEDVVEDKTPEVDDPNRVNFSKYGAVGDGNTDDTKAIQAALDAEESLVADEGAVFRITARLDIDKSGDQNIDWNGSTITVTSTLYQAIEIKKPSGRTTMSDLTIDGAKKLAAGIFIKTVSDFDNVDVKYLYSTTQTTWAFRYEVTDIPNSQGDSTFNDCDCYDVESKSNGVIGDIPGPSRCLIFRWKHSGSSPTVTFNGGVWDGAWGDDGDIFQHEQLVSNIYNSRLIFNNTVMKNFSRRIVKGTGGGVTFKNVTFISPSKSNPRLVSTVPSSGMVAMGNFINSEDAHGTIFDGCTFDNTLGYDGRLVINRQDGIIVKNSNFINASVAFTTRVGDVEICNNTFDSKSSIYGYNINDATGYTGMISIGNNNNGSTGFIRLPDGKYKMTDCQ
ncbi:Ig-like domain-containing protein [Arenibacter latericius]|uniref:Ig-like domain-containing protein n=1 Tax=Arenibacter latericius TaxID=86104 RepID=UPI0003F53AB2|nr:Ig-like domain-containing protein [Arenibacter latericius]